MDKLPPAFVTALEISAIDHMKMVAAVAPFIDTSISKTVNVPADYPYEDFKGLYTEAWKAGLKGLATYRPNNVLGSVLSVTPEIKPAKTEATEEQPQDFIFDQDRRIVLEATPKPALASLRWPGRPELPNGSSGWVSQVVKHPLGSFVVFVSHTSQRPQPSVRGLGERLGAAARTRRAGEVAVDGHAHRGSRCGCG